MKLNVEYLKYGYWFTVPLKTMENQANCIWINLNESSYFINC